MKDPKIQNDLQHNDHNAQKIETTEFFLETCKKHSKNKNYITK